MFAFIVFEAVFFNDDRARAVIDTQSLTSRNWGDSIRFKIQARD